MVAITNTLWPYGGGGSRDSADRLQKHQKSTLRMRINMRVLSRKIGFFIGILNVLISQTTSKRPQNILFIVVDDLRPALGCYGEKSAHTPNIDGLAERSIIFNNAYAQQALCAPSRNSFLTSRRPDTLHLYDFYNYWRDFTGNFTTLPEYFKEHGYYTSSFGKVFHPGISSNWSDDQPYSWSVEPFHPPSQKYMNAAVCRGLDGKLHRNIVCPVEVEFQPGGTLPDLEILTAAVNFLQDRRNSSKNPFFLAVGFHKPHVPLKFPKQYINLHPLESIQLPKARSYPSLLPTVAWNPWTDVRKREDVVALNVSFPFGPMPDSFARKIKQSYFAAVSYVDDLIGHLLNAVKENGYFDNTIIVLLGDHGWSMAEHGEWAKFSNFEIALRVPLLLYVPGKTDFKTSILYKTTHVLTELVDIFPTLVELTNLSHSLPLCPEKSMKIKLCTEGISLVPVIENMQEKTNNPTVNMDWKKAAFSQYPRPGIFPTLHPNSDKPHLNDIKIMGYSLRTLRYRYTEWISFDNHNFIPQWTTKMGAELYDHKLDPRENFNLVDNKEMINIVQMLSVQLHAGWRYSLPKHFIKNVHN